MGLRLYIKNGPGCSPAQPTNGSAHACSQVRAELEKDEK